VTLSDHLHPLGLSSLWGQQMIQAPFSAFAVLERHPNDPPKLHKLLSVLGTWQKPNMERPRSHEHALQRSPNRNPLSNQRFLMLRSFDKLCGQTPLLWRFRRRSHRKITPHQGQRQRQGAWLPRCAVHPPRRHAYLRALSPLHLCAHPPGLQGRRSCGQICRRA
jgi:hypothetical protein